MQTNCCCILIRNSLLESSKSQFDFQCVGLIKWSGYEETSVVGRKELGRLSLTSGNPASWQAGNLAATTSIARCSAHIRSAPLASHFFPFSRAFRGTILSQSWEILDRTLLVIDEHSLFNFSTDASPLNLLSLVRVLFQLALTISSASKFAISWLLNRKQFASFDFSTSAETCIVRTGEPLDSFSENGAGQCVSRSYAHSNSLMGSVLFNMCHLSKPGSRHFVCEFW